MCQIVEINRSSFYAWQNAAPTRAERATAGAELDGWIRAVHDDDNTCGAPRITAELNDGLPVEDRINHKRVGRGDARERHRRLPAPPPGPHHDPEPADHKVPDLLKRDFTAPAPNQRYVGDITYLPLSDGENLYLATVIDCYSRRIVGWAVADHMRTELVEDALPAARPSAAVWPGRFPQRPRLAP